jgi:hypothetical protein
LEHKKEVDMQIYGYNGQSEKAKHGGINEDGVYEIFVEGMPDDKVLLCAADYAHKGAVVLSSLGGAVYSLTESQKKQPDVKRSSSGSTFPSLIMKRFLISLPTTTFIMSRMRKEVSIHFLKKMVCQIVYR